MSLVVKFAHAPASSTPTYTACRPIPRRMSRHRIGSRKKSMNESQYRVGRYGAIGDAASRVSSSDDAISTASAPSVADGQDRPDGQLLRGERRPGHRGAGQRLGLEQRYTEQVADHGDDQH